MSKSKDRLHKNEVQLPFILESLDYIEKNLHERVDLDRAAKLACLSRYHYQRVFADYTGLGPGEFLRSRRLTEAASELLHTQRTIEYVSSQYGYESLAAFSRAFSQQFGQSPRQFRSAPNPSLKSAVAPLSESLLSHWNLGGISVKPESVTMDEMSLCGIIFVNRYGDDLSAQLKKIQELYLQYHSGLISLEPQVWLIQHGNDESVRAEVNYSFLGLERKYFKEVPQAALCVQVPKSNYQKFEHLGLTQELFNYTARYIWDRWWKAYDQKGFDWILCRLDQGELSKSHFIARGGIYLPEMTHRQALIPNSVWSEFVDHV